MFDLTTKQKEKLKTWQDSLPGGPTGAIGGRFTFCFTPTSLGLVVKVQDGISKQEIDLSDYEEW